MKNHKKIIVSAAAAVLAAASVTPCTSLAAITPNPVISRNCPAYSGDNPATAVAANDEHYFSFAFLKAPDYLAYDLSAVPEAERKQVIAVWYNTSSYDKLGAYANANMEPSDYTIEVNAAPGGTYPEDGWVVVDTVEGSTYGSRQHLVDFEGYNWIRLNVSKADGKEGSQASVNFDIHNVSEGVSDSWIFFGDSITAMSMNNCYGTGFATHVNEIDSRYFPVQENGGIGGITSTDGKENIDRWLSFSPAKYVSIAYGTNDCWGNPGNTETYYQNTKYMIDAILAAGKVPVLGKIPGSTNKDVGPNVPLYNAKVEQLWEEYGDKLVQGPDLEAFFTEHPEYLSEQDGVHPTSEGQDAMRKLWAETMYERVYTADSPQQPTTEPPVEPTTEPTSEEPAYDVLWGDANEDQDVDLNDAVAILQHVALEKKYGLSEYGRRAADVVDTGDSGITGMDALAIMMIDADMVKEDELPITSEDLNSRLK